MRADSGFSTIPITGENSIIHNIPDGVISDHRTANFEEEKNFENAANQHEGQHSQSFSKIQSRNPSLI
jgi:hypothetical protein